MSLRPDAASLVGLFTAGGIFLIYNNALPSAASIRASAQHDNDVEAARKKAAWVSLGLIGITFAVAREINSYLISGVALFGVDYMYKHENAVNPMTQKLDTGNDTLDASLHPLPEYTNAS